MYETIIETFYIGVFAELVSKYRPRKFFPDLSKNPLTNLYVPHIITYRQISMGGDGMELDEKKLPVIFKAFCDENRIRILKQELICKWWFLPSNTYDCGSFVVN